MSVAETITLPGQPASGVVHRTPLGGDGFAAPMAAYIVDNMELTGAAGSGNITATILMDERFCSLVAYATVSITQATDQNMGVRYRLDTSLASSPVATQVQSRFLTAGSSNTSPATINDVWVPVPVILPGDGGGGLLSVGSVNFDTDLFRVSALIYLFDINVRQVMPMGPLLWARGAT